MSARPLNFGGGDISLEKLMKISNEVKSVAGTIKVLQS
jgi:hypothetical protein